MSTILRGSGDTTFGGTIQSTGIDDNATSTAITIDSSENVLIGMTAVSGTTDGFHLRPGIASGVNVTNDHCFALNRKSSDGEVLRFLKDGGLVGSIDVSASGASIKLGGTAAANALDDYETGTWTPTLITAGASFTENNSGTYTKIGRVVTISGVITLTSVTAGNGNYQVSSLPYTPATPSAAYEYYNSVFTTGSLTTNSDGIGIHNNSNCYFLSDGATSSGGAAAGTTLFTLTYIT